MAIFNSYVKSEGKRKDTYFLIFPTNEGFGVPTNLRKNNDVAREDGAELDDDEFQHWLKRTREAQAPLTLRESRPPNEIEGSF